MAVANRNESLRDPDDEPAEHNEESAAPEPAQWRSQQHDRAHDCDESGARHCFDPPLFADARLDGDHLNFHCRRHGSEVVAPNRLPEGG